MGVKFLNVLLSWTLLMSGDAARVARHNTTKAAGRVSHMFTFGAPHPSNPKITTKSGGCIKGYRVTAWRDDLFVDNEDIVPTLLVPSTYDQPNVKTLAVNGKGSGVQSTWSCGSNPIRFTNPSVSLHDKQGYMDKMDLLDSSYSRAKTASRFLLMSYDHDKSAVRKAAAAEGWRLVGTAPINGGEDVSHLFQEPGSLRCILTFEGSDEWDDWLNNAKVKSASYCGLPMRVHTGFMDELRKMVNSDTWQNEIRPKLGKCSSVDTMGHSLGGATVTLFTACADFQNGSEDYQKISWTTERSKLMSQV